jgi:hypothetical protein
VEETAGVVVPLQFPQKTQKKTQRPQRELLFAWRKSFLWSLWETPTFSYRSFIFAV